ncbi:GNAT family protein [Paracoccus sp. DMF-8]|uniref:GNAT family N-acetyltransferase n=1 Tax=Paracoccus TaxID=265 RepID=UPI000782C14A|nr:MULTISPECIES: GNAT family protein [Paracoccus]MDF3606640.1 GNAT family protein [Paracoccus sp. DMF-8]
MITLEPLGRDGYDRVAHIAVTPQQEPFCGTIAGHFQADESGCDFHLIARDGRPVGFFKIDRAYAARYDFAAPDELGLRGVMVDAREQGKGSGKAAMRALGPYVARRYPQARALVLTVNEANPLARAVYLAAGFRDTGALHHGGQIGPQHILRLPLRA